MLQKEVATLSLLSDIDTFEFFRFSENSATCDPVCSGSKTQISTQIAPFVAPSCVLKV